MRGVARPPAPTRAGLRCRARAPGTRAHRRIVPIPARASSQGDDDLPTDMWKTKPAWCQPYSIVATGVLATATPVNVLHLDERVAGWFGTLSTTVVGAAVLAWWFLFLYVVPREYERSVEAFREDRRRRGGGDAP